MASKKTTNQESSIAANENVHLVDLGDILEVGKIAGLYQRLEAALDVDEGAIELQAQRIERVDAATLQLLVVFRREATALGYSISWRGPSDSLRKAARNVGLTSSLGLN